MVQRIDKLLVGVCAVLAFTAVSADVSDDFEGDTTSWTGNATITTGTYTYEKAVGLPLTGDTQAHSKYLEVAGQAVRSYGTDAETTGETVTVDMMVKVTAADELPDAPEDTTDIQVAVAAGPLASDTATAAPLYIYSKATDDSETCTWNSTGKSYTTNSWVRLMLVMDYANSQCKVTVDGDVIATVDYVGKPATDKKVSSLTVEGSTALDDVVVKVSSSSASDITPFPETATSDTATVGDGDEAVPVKLNWLYKNGIDGSKTDIMKTTCSDNSGMTYAQKYEAGLDINDEKKFEVTSMSVTDANTAAFTVPGQADSYVVELTDADGTTVSGATLETTKNTDGTTTATVNLSNVTTSSKVIKFTVKAKATKVQ